MAFALELTADGHDLVHRSLLLLRVVDYPGIPAVAASKAAERHDGPPGRAELLNSQSAILRAGRGKHTVSLPPSPPLIATDRG